MMRAAIAIALVGAGAGACTVPDLDLTGKHCPCASGWTCETSTDLCVRAPGDDAAPDDGAAPDGAAIDAPTDARVVDGPPVDGDPGTSCLGSAPGASLYSDDFADLIGWVTSGGTWSASGGEARQSSATATQPYAYPAGTGTFTDYRVAVRAHRTGGTTGELGVGLRQQTANSARYHCAWQPQTGLLAIAWVRNNGTVGGTLVQKMIDLASMPGYDPAMVVTMEAQVQGSQLSCCLREVAGASITVSDTRYVAGAPAITTNLLAAGFGDLQVNAP